MSNKKLTFNNRGLNLSFTKKQVVLLELIILAYSAAEIAQRLHRSKRTIEGHIEQLKYKLHCTSKAEIIRWAITSGFLYRIDKVSDHAARQL